MAGIEMTHVPYKGGAPALAALIAGEVQVSFTSSVAITQAKAGRMKTLAVTGAKRSPIAPDVPTIAESGVAGYEWVPAGTASRRRSKTVEAHRPERLNTTINRVLPELQDRYTALGLDLAGGTPEEFGAHLKSELGKWARVVKLTGARAN